MARPYKMLRDLMRSQEYTQAELGEVLGLNACSVSQRMNAHVPWDAEEMWRIMELFNVPARRLHEVFPPRGINEAGAKHKDLRKGGKTA